MAIHHAAALRKAMHLGFFGVVTYSQSNFGHNVAGRQDSLPTYAHKEHVHLFNHCVTSTGGIGIPPYALSGRKIASRGQTCKHTSQPTHSSASIAALGRFVLASH